MNDDSMCLSLTVVYLCLLFVWYYRRRWKRLAVVCKKLWTEKRTSQINYSSWKIICWPKGFYRVRLKRYHAQNHCSCNNDFDTSALRISFYTCQNNVRVGWAVSLYGVDCSSDLTRFVHVGSLSSFSQRLLVVHCSITHSWLKILYVLFMIGF